MTMQELKHKIVVFSPVGRTKVLSNSNELAKRLGEIEGKTISFLDSAQVEAKLLEDVERLFRERYKPKETYYWQKPSRSHPAPQQMVKDIIEKSDAVIIGVTA